MAYHSRGLSLLESRWAAVIGMFQRSFGRWLPLTDELLAEYLQVCIRRRVLVYGP